jgi:hypothetical protein
VGRIKMALEHPTETHDRNPPKSAKRPWFSLKTPQLGLVLGGRGAGKSEAVGWIATQYYNKGMTVVHPFSAPQENLYYVINKNCKALWDKWREENNKLPKDHREMEPLHCNCDRVIPILLMVPDYVEFDEYTVDRFNGRYFRDKEEYREAFRKGLIKEVLESTPENPIDWTRIGKPKELIQNPLIVIKKFTCPTTSQRTLIFDEQFAQGMFQAKLEHRILVMNPIFFDAQRDLFETEAEIFKTIKTIMLSDDWRELKPDEIEKRRKQGKPLPKDLKSKVARLWNTAMLVVNEVRAIAPSSRLSGEKESTASKRTLFALIPVIRHHRLWGLFDYQQNEDLFVGIRNLANWVLIKRAHDLILGEDWKWFTTKLDNDRENIIKYQYRGVKTEESINDLRNRRPRIEELPVDQGYIVYYDGSYRKHTFQTPPYHHKSELEDFSGDTGIEWTIKKKEGISSEGKQVSKQVTGKRKKEKEIVMGRIDQFVKVEKLTFKEVVQKMAELEQDGLVPTWDFANMNPRSLNNRYNDWVKSKGIQNK